LHVFSGSGAFGAPRHPRSWDMRFFLGLVVGVLMTIAVAYLIDASSSGPNESTAQVEQQKPLVNWDVVDKDWRSFTHGVRNTWNRLASIH
jgi:hypothetical protein